MREGITIKGYGAVLIFARCSRIAFLLLLLIQGSISAQSIGEIHSRLAGEIPDTLRATLMEDLAWTYREIDVDSTRFFALQAIILGNKTGQKKVVAYALSDLGFYFRVIGKFDSAHVCLDQSQHYRNLLGNLKDISSGHNQLGLLFYNQDDFESAVLEFEKGIERLQGTSEYKSLANLSDGLGKSFLGLQKFPEALDAIQRGLYLNELIKDSIGIAKSMQNLGMYFQQTGRSEMALGAYERALYIYQRYGLDLGIAQVLINKGMILNERGQALDALQCLERARKVATTAGNLLLLNDIYNDLALIHRRRGDYSTAEKFHRLDFESSNENGLSQRAIIAAVNIAELYDLQDQHAAALTALEQAESLGTIPQHLMVLVMGVKADANGGLGNFEEAFEWRNKQRKLEDSIAGAMSGLQDLTDKYLKEKAKSEIAAQAARVTAAKLAQAEAEGRTKTMLIIVVMVLLALIVLAALSFYRNQQLKIRTLQAEAQVAEERALNQERYTEIQNILQDAELKALRLSMETQQRERTRIASNLHDRLGSKLSVVQWLFQSLVKYQDVLPDKAREKYGQGITFIEEACNEVREIARNMQSGDLAHFGLQMALERFCDQVRLSCDLKVTFNAFGAPRRLPAELEGEIYAVVRTLIENILRHADASECSVQLHYHTESLQVMVEDDGRGFDPSATANVPGIGLKNVRQRVESQEGNIAIDSKPNKGTCITVSFPIAFNDTIK